MGQPPNLMRSGALGWRPSVWGFVGIGSILAGVVLSIVGWYGASGEALVAAQVPYLASATFPGGAAIVAGAVLLASDRSRDAALRAEQLVAALYQLLTEPISSHESEEATSDPSTVGALVALPAGTTYHRGDCSLVRGKPDAVVVGDAAILERALTPCRVCEPLIPG